MANEICGIETKSMNLNQIIERRNFIIKYGNKEQKKIILKFEKEIKL